MYIPLDVFLTMLALLCLFLFLAPSWGCSSDADCGSVDKSQPGRCQAGFCQCGVGYVGNQLVDPTSCSRSCSPAALGDGQLPMDPLRLDVYVRDAHLVVDVTLASFASELPEEISLLRLSNGTRCSLIPLMLGTHSLEQHVEASCQRRFVLSMPFEPSLCWDLHENRDANMLTYRSGLEIVQRSAVGAAFNGVGHRATRGGAPSTGLSRTFRKEVVINVQHHAVLHSNAVKSVAAPEVAFAVTLVDYRRNAVVIEIQSRAYESQSALTDVRVSMDHVKGVKLLGLKSSACDASHLTQNQCRQTHTLVFDVTHLCQVKGSLEVAASLLKHRVRQTLPVDWDACPRQ